MKTEIQIFNNPQFGEVRIAMSENNEPMFCLADLCKAIGLEQVSRVKSRLDDGVTSSYPIIDNLGREQLANFVSESGMYEVIIRSDTEQSKPFRKWVTSEVLPSIRKNGGYITSNEDDSPELIMARALQVAQTTIENHKNKLKAAENTINKLAPKAELLDRVLDCGEKIDVGQAAKILKLPFGRNTMFAKLREMGIFFKQRNEPKQEYIDRKYFEVYEQMIPRNSHDSFIVLKILVTQKGLAFIDKLFCGEKSDKVMAKLQSN